MVLGDGTPLARRLKVKHINLEPSDTDTPVLIRIRAFSDWSDFEESFKETVEHSRHCRSCNATSAKSTVRTAIFLEFFFTVAS